MAETPADQSPARSQPEARPGSGNQYWCYHCDKRVAVETLGDLPDVVCCDCKNGFVELIAAAAVPSAAAAVPDPLEDPNFGSQFIQVLRLIAQAAREEDAPPPLPSDPSSNDYLQIELDEWDNDDEEEEEEDYEDEHSVEVVREEEDEEVENRERGAGNNRSVGSGDEDEEGIEVVAREDDNDNEDEMVEMMRRRRDVLRLRLRDFASRAASRRNRILDWADVLMGLEDHSIELTLQVPDSDTYVGNPGDYVDASEYEALLQNLAESDSGARRGAPPAAKSVVEGLEGFRIDKEENVIACAICKDTVNVGEIAKNLPCGHGYHGDCIVPWLGARNSCPVCRFELPTDDPEYEEDRKKRVVSAGLRVASSSSSPSSAAAASGGDSPDSALA
ncbi:E3 ubiquitin-protein ligase CIP8 [Salvia hispanica]|uniref:E3 ubiquitin-protein ligase CIP8 n=1 Tax=Salvia hispanica TaxID=49212 RepID=UPI002009D653|nr:E3 ubiquitin-protein ligase CIP8 [Salvia hispanica]XP_047978260.1 E3 ubiquitin-protein ligase CIP8 [Salvia hispanica]XP_047978261.1 E3 ubiquitin-protein ligase CIP8 [Salvia hispanica]XP_047978262.1 E3 ubiquitin-protein ligase CIP8 [Salvia hispanica]XP_047978263.1 E3 ubiquitin-protein ligase CIP8 [Salvia hispanica]